MINNIERYNTLYIISEYYFKRPQKAVGPGQTPYLPIPNAGPAYNNVPGLKIYLSKIFF